MTQKRSRWRVSPTLFVVLLLLGAMALVAGALILIEPEGGREAPPPQLEFRENETMDAVVVNTTESGLVWEEFQVQMDRPGAFRIVDDNGTWRDVEPLVFTDIGHATAVEEEDMLIFCTHEEGANVEVGLRHRQSRQLVSSWTMGMMRGCQVQENPDLDLAFTA